MLITGFSACNSGDETPGSSKHGCNPLHVFQANDQEQQILTSNGFNVGDVIIYNNLTSAQKAIFNAYTLPDGTKLDSTSCYELEP